MDVTAELGAADNRGGVEVVLSPIDLSRERPPGTAPLLELLARQQAARIERSTKQLASRRQRNVDDTAPRTSHPQAPKRLFLAELEVVGNVQGACAAAGCSAADVRRWRAGDPMFSRDFVLAIVAHMRVLKQMLREVTDEGHSPAAEKACRLLASEPRYVDSDGRLDVHRWCEALRTLVIELGLDLERWEPKEPAA